MTEAKLLYEKNMRIAKEEENKRLINTITDLHLTNKLLWGALVVQSLLVLVLIVVLVNG